MAVKSIVRNLFVSGALALSVGAVCGRPVSANNAIADMVSAASACLMEAEKCIGDVLKESATRNGDLYCVNAHELTECTSQRIKCLSKVYSDFSQDL